jgi:mono/diheme cytochrome c family protein
MAISLRVTALPGAVLALAMTAHAQLTPAEEGRKLYLANNCYSCHGDVGGGSPYGAPVLKGGEIELGDFTEVLREGGDRGMPAFRNLNNTTDINYLVAYLRSLGSSSEPTFYLWWDPGLPTARMRSRVPRFTAALRKRPAPLR